MTCIVGLVEGNKTYIGGDSASSSDWTTRTSLTKKVFKVGPFLIGYTSSFRMGQILQYQINFPESEVYDEKYMVTEFVEAARIKFKELGYSKIVDNEEIGGNFLVCVSGNLYVIESDFQVNHYVDKFDAVGSGYSYALGAMEALRFLPPEDRIYRSLEIASKFVNSVREPFTILSS
jgi:ATP-dependent protease HslVU (ClpYQ) peptidase subunit